MLEKLVLTFLPFALISSITPGPNNIMLAASGVNFGLARTLPHLAGVVLGFPIMVFVIGCGLGEIFNAHPALHEILRWVGAAYLVVLAWQIANAKPKQIEDQTRVKPISFLRGFLFQWVNPKAWIMAISAITTYTIPGYDTYPQLATIAVIFFLICIPVSGGWALFGTSMKRFLQSPKALRRFNYAMAALLILSLIPIFWE